MISVCAIVFGKCVSGISFLIVNICRSLTGMKLLSLCSYRRMIPTAGIFCLKDGDNMRADENGDTQLYIPFVVYIRNGTVVDAHVSTLDDDDPEFELTEEQKGKLKQIYYSGFIRAGL